MPGLKDDIDKDGINNLDDIFIVRDCFGDKNKNNKWDLSEPIGFTFKPAGTTKVRPNRPQKEGAYIGISLKDVNSQEIPGARAKIKVSFQNDSCGLGEDCDYEYEVPVENGKIYIEPPTEDFDAMVEIGVSSQGKNMM